MEARTVLVGRTEEGLLCDPGSLLRQEGGKKRRAKIIYFEVLGGKTSYLNTTTTTVLSIISKIHKSGNIGREAFLEQRP